MVSTIPARDLFRFLVRYAVLPGGAFALMYVHLEGCLTSVCPGSSYLAGFGMFSTACIAFVAIIVSVVLWVGFPTYAGLWFGTITVIGGFFNVQGLAWWMDLGSGLTATDYEGILMTVVYLSMSAYWAYDYTQEARIKRRAASKYSTPEQRSWAVFQT